MDSSAHSHHSQNISIDLETLKGLLPQETDRQWLQAVLESKNLLQNTISSFQEDIDAISQGKFDATADADLINNYDFMPLDDMPYPDFLQKRLESVQQALTLNQKNLQKNSQYVQLHLKLKKIEEEVLEIQKLYNEKQQIIKQRASIKELQEKIEQALDHELNKLTGKERLKKIVQELIRDACNHPLTVRENFLKDIDSLMSPSNASEKSAFNLFFTDTTEHLLQQLAAHYDISTQDLKTQAKHLRTSGNRWNFLHHIARLSPHLPNAYVKQVMTNLLRDNSFYREMGKFFFTQKFPPFLVDLLQGIDLSSTEYQTLKISLLDRIKEQKKDVVFKCLNTHLGSLKSILSDIEYKVEYIQKYQKGFTQQARERNNKELKDLKEQAQLCLNNIDAFFHPLLDKYDCSETLLVKIGECFDKCSADKDISHNCEQTLFPLLYKAQHRSITSDTSKMAYAQRAILAQMMRSKQPWSNEDEALLQLIMHHYEDNLSLIIPAAWSEFYSKIPSTLISLKDKKNRHSLYYLCSALLRGGFQQDTQRLVRLLEASILPKEELSFEDVVGLYRDIKKELKEVSLEATGSMVVPEELLILLFKHYKSEELSSHEFAQKIQLIDESERSALLPFLLDSLTVKNFNDYYNCMTVMSANEAHYYQENDNMVMQYPFIFPARKRLTSLAEYVRDNIDALQVSNDLYNWVVSTSYSPSSRNDSETLSGIRLLINLVDDNNPSENTFVQNYMVGHLMLQLGTQTLPEKPSSDFDDSLHAIVKDVSGDISVEDAHCLYDSLLRLTQTLGEEPNNQRKIDLCDQWQKYLKDYIAEKEFSEHLKVFFTQNFNSPDRNEEEEIETQDFSDNNKQLFEMTEQSKTTALIPSGVESFESLMQFISSINSKSHLDEKIYLFHSALLLLKNPEYQWGEKHIEALAGTYNSFVAGLSEEESVILRANMISDMFQVNQCRPDLSQELNSLFNDIFNVDKSKVQRAKSKVAHFFGMNTTVDQTAEQYYNAKIKPIFDNIKDSPQALQYAKDAYIGYLMGLPEQQSREQLTLMKSIYEDSTTRLGFEKYVDICQKHMPVDPRKKWAYVEKFLNNAATIGLMHNETQHQGENILQILVKAQPSDFDKILELQRVINYFPKGALSDLQQSIVDLHKSMISQYFVKALKHQQSFYSIKEKVQQCQAVSPELEEIWREHIEAYFSQPFNYVLADNKQDIRQEMLAAYLQTKVVVAAATTEHPDDKSDKDKEVDITRLLNEVLLLCQENRFSFSEQILFYQLFCKKVNAAPLKDVIEDKYREESQPLSLQQVTEELRVFEKMGPDGKALGFQCLADKAITSALHPNISLIDSYKIYHLLLESTLGVPLQQQQERKIKAKLLELGRELYFTNESAAIDIQQMYDVHQSLYPDMIFTKYFIDHEQPDESEDSHSSDHESHPIALINGLASEGSENKISVTVVLQLVKESYPFCGSLTEALFDVERDITQLQNFYKIDKSLDQSERSHRLERLEQMQQFAFALKKLFPKSSTLSPKKRGSVSSFINTFFKEKALDVSQENTAVQNNPTVENILNLLNAIEKQLPKELKPYMTQSLKAALLVEMFIMSAVAKKGVVPSAMPIDKILKEKLSEESSEYTFRQEFSSLTVSQIEILKDQYLSLKEQASQGVFVNEQYFENTAQRLLARVKALHMLTQMQEGRYSPDDIQSQKDFINISQYYTFDELDPINAFDLTNTGSGRDPRTKRTDIYSFARQWHNLPDSYLAEQREISMGGLPVLLPLSGYLHDFLERHDFSADIKVFSGQANGILDQECDMQVPYLAQLHHHEQGQREKFFSDIRDCLEQSSLASLKPIVSLYDAHHQAMSLYQQKSAAMIRTAISEVKEVMTSDDIYLASARKRISEVLQSHEFRLMSCDIPQDLRKEILFKFPQSFSLAFENKVSALTQSSSSLDDSHLKKIMEELLSEGGIRSVLVDIGLFQKSDSNNQSKTVNGLKEYMSSLFGGQYQISEDFFENLEADLNSQMSKMVSRKSLRAKLLETPIFSGRGAVARRERLINTLFTNQSELYHQSLQSIENYHESSLLQSLEDIHLKGRGIKDKIVAQYQKEITSETLRNALIQYQEELSHDFIDTALKHLHSDKKTEVIINSLQEFYPDISQEILSVIDEYSLKNRWPDILDRIQAPEEQKCYAAYLLEEKMGNEYIHTTSLMELAEIYAQHSDNEAFRQAWCGGFNRLYLEHASQLEISALSMENAAQIITSLSANTAEEAQNLLDHRWTRRLAASLPQSPHNTPKWLQSCYDAFEKLYRNSRKLLDETVMSLKSSISNLQKNMRSASQKDIQDGIKNTYSELSTVLKQCSAISKALQLLQPYVLKNVTLDKDRQEFLALNYELMGALVNLSNIKEDKVFGLPRVPSKKEKVLGALGTMMNQLNDEYLADLLESSQPRLIEKTMTDKNGKKEVIQQTFINDDVVKGIHASMIALIDRTEELSEIERADCRYMAYSMLKMAKEEAQRLAQNNDMVFDSTYYTEQLVSLYADSAQSLSKLKEIKATDSINVAFPKTTLLSEYQLLRQQEEKSSAHPVAHNIERARIEIEESLNNIIKDFTHVFENFEKYSQGHQKHIWNSAKDFIEMAAETIPLPAETVTKLKSSLSGVISKQGRGNINPKLSVIVIKDISTKQRSSIKEGGEVITAVSNSDQLNTDLLAVPSPQSVEQISIIEEQLCSHISAPKLTDPPPGAFSHSLKNRESQKGQEPGTHNSQ